VKIPVLLAAFAAYLVSGSNLPAQQIPPAGTSLTAVVTADTGTAAEGRRDGSAAAAERSVAGRAIVGFIGGLPIGLFGLVGPGDPALAIGVGSGVGIVGAAWRLGRSDPPLNQSIQERSESYRRAYSESYKDRLRKRRGKAAILGGVAGVVSGFGLLIALLSDLDT